MATGWTLAWWGVGLDWVTGRVFTAQVRGMIAQRRVLEATG